MLGGVAGGTKWFFFLLSVVPYARTPIGSGHCVSASASVYDHSTPLVGAVVAVCGGW